MGDNEIQGSGVPESPVNAECVEPTNVDSVQPVETGKKRRSRRKGIALTSLIIGIVAFLIGWMPFIGFLVGATAVVLGIIGLVKKQAKGLSISGLALGSVAALTSIIVFLAVIVGAAGNVSVPKDQPKADGASGTTASATPAQVESTTPTPSPSKTQGLSGREAWVAEMEADGWAEMNDKIWLKWASPDSYSCGSFNCGYAFIAVENDCRSGVYVEVAIMQGNLSVGSDSNITSALYLDGDTIPIARVKFQDYANTPDGAFKVTNLYCMD